MSAAAIILSDDFSPQPANILGAFNEQEHCVGQASSTVIPFGPHAGDEAFIIQIYSNSFSGGEIISFKLYMQETEEIFLIENTVEFIQDGVVGSILSPLLFLLIGPEEEPPPDPEEDPPYTDENNDGYDDASYIVGATGGDINLDLVINVADIVSLVNLILSGE